jgi:hypothetical protein
MIKPGSRKETRQKTNNRRENNKMKINKNFIFGILLTAAAILLEVFWIQTGATALGVFTLVIALSASGAYARALPLDYTTSDSRLRKFLSVVGLES